MFEGKPPIASGANTTEHGEPVGEKLCALDWAELVAKLAAARDLRRELASDDGEGSFASFDAECAQHIAALHDKVPEGQTAGNGKRAVNPDDLANGKAVCATIGRRAESDVPANRGNT